MNATIVTLTLSNEQYKTLIEAFEDAYSEAQQAHIHAESSYDWGGYVGRLNALKRAIDLASIDTGLLK